MDKGKTASTSKGTTPPLDTENGNANNESGSKNDAEAKLSNKREASWPSVLFYIHLNILGLYGIIVLLTQTKLITIGFSEYN